MSDVVFSASAPFLQHDPNSGQVFNESIYCAPKHAVKRNWIYSTTGRQQHKYRHSRGASPLKSATLRYLLQNFHHVEPEAFASVPLALAKRVWKKLSLLSLVSVQVWRVFACAFPPEVPETVHPWQDYRKYIPISAITTLHEFIGPVTSLACRWITVLSLPALLSSRTELASLSDMTNLGALHISPTLAETCDRPDGDFVLDDSILRAWSRAAVQNGGFKSLRFLALINHRSITLQGLEYLEAIPTLMICDLTGSAIRTADVLAATSKSSGWELIRCDPTEKSPPAEAPSQVMQTLSAEYHMAASRLPSFHRRGNVGSSVLTLLIGTAGDGPRRRLKNRRIFRRVCLRLEDPAASSSSTTPAQGKRKTSVSSGSCPAKRNKRCDFEKQTAAEGEEQAEKAEREEEEEEESIPKQPSVGKRDDKQKKKQKKKRRRRHDAALDDGKTRNLTDMLADFAAA